MKDGSPVGLVYGVTSLVKYRRVAVTLTVTVPRIVLQISNMTKELECVEESPRAEMHIDLLKTTLEKYQIGKHLAMVEYMDSVQEIHHHSRQTNSRNEQMPTRSTHTQMDDQRKDHIDQEGTPQRNRPKQLQTHNLPTENVENINSTKAKDLLLAYKPQIVP